MTDRDALDTLEAIYDAGEAVLRALEIVDFDGVSAALEERGTLLVRLQAYNRPPEPSSEWLRLEEALRGQHARVTEAYADHEQRMGEALAHVARYKEARQQYGQRRRSGILNDKLRV